MQTYEETTKENWRISSVRETGVHLDEYGAGLGRGGDRPGVDHLRELLLPGVVESLVEHGLKELANAGKGLVTVSLHKSITPGFG